MAETPPPCERIEEFYGYAARRLMTRLFRNYLTEVGATAAETLHLGPEMKRVLRMRELMTGAVAQAVRIQGAGDAGAALTERYFTFGDKISERARGVEGVTLPPFEMVGYDGACAAIAAGTHPEPAEFLIRVAIARELARSRDPWAKLQALVGWAERARDASTLPLNDFIADLLAAPALGEAIAGRRRHPIDRLLFLTEIGDGTAKAGDAFADAAQGAVVERLAKLVAAGKLPDVRRAVGDLIADYLASPGPMTNDQPIVEEQMVRRLTLSLVPPDRPMTGGAVAATAIVERIARITGRPDVAGAAAAADEVVRMLGETARQIRFLRALADGPLMAEIGDTIARLLHQSVTAAADLGAIDRQGGTYETRLERVTAVWQAIDEAPIEATIKAELSAHIDGLLLGFLSDEDVVARYDGDGAPFPIRARRMVGLCFPGRLPPRGRARDHVKIEVLTRLRTAGFETALVAHIEDPAVKTKTLRTFFDLMKRAGFV